jgi:hypothetical protein
MKKQYRDFESAREFVRTLELKNLKEWQDYSKSGKRPNNIPGDPRNVYKKQGIWISWGDFLGNGNISERFKVYRPFAEAREFVRSLGLKHVGKWREYCKSGEKPDNIPATPERTYKKKGWINHTDWLGTGTVATNERKFRPFAEARKFTISLNLKGQKEWFEYCKSGDKPDDIPASPGVTYKKDFKGWGDWLGTGTVANFNKQFRPFNEAREFVRSLGLKGYDEWETYCKSGDKPDDIPSNPWQVHSEWKRK